MTHDNRIDALAVEAALAKAAARRVPLPEPAMRRLLRERAGLTQWELAGLIGVGRNCVSRYEHGIREPQGSVRTAYAEVLGLLAARGGQ